MASKPKHRKRNDFSQETPPFLIYVKNILNKYPDGGQILKELIQNADDAGASKVIFFYDERDYGTETLYADELVDFQGPALLAYNNATFSDNDWKGIQSTGQSHKLKDPNTVGRFGLGFNSVYHITDLPCIFSGSSIGMLDPQKAVFGKGGYKWNLQDEEDTKDLQELTDQFLPFQNALSAINCGDWDTILKSGYFNGTLFRFPLRQSDSKISDNLYSSERVVKLFECFTEDAVLNVLFLRKVTQVSLKSIGLDGLVKNLLTVTVTVQDNGSFPSTISSSSKLLTSMDVKDTSLEILDRCDEKCKWLVIASTIKEGSFPDLECLAEKLSNIPTIGLAYSLESEKGKSSEGRLSCYLPLPDKEENRTGLPVHINASFDLTDDRRSIKWVEADQHDDGAQCNQLLVEKMLPLVYCHAVQAVVSLVRSSTLPTDLVYSIWPDPKKTQHKERWHWLTEQISQDLLDVKVLCKAVDRTQWLKASEAVFVPIVQDNGIQHALEELLLCVGEALVKVPEHIYEAIQLATRKSKGVTMATPSFIRRVLQRDSWSIFSNQQKILILQYVISDGQYRDLLGLQLVPLSNGAFTCFNDNDKNGLALIESPKFPRTVL